MTIMRVSLAGTPLSELEKQELAKRLIGAFAEVEMGRDSPQIREGFVVHFESLDPSDLWPRPQRSMGCSAPVDRVNKSYCSKLTSKRLIKKLSIST